ncbi:MAG: adenine phosphoribosyltransferase [Opitutales bacterium]|nr:adenine phosphoribosyltransferase [Opitutales bacterium]
MNIQEHIAVIKDFPRKGVVFKDISPIFLHPKAFKELIGELAQKIRPLGATKIFAAEARGFLFGAPLSIELGIPLVLVRKKGKLPRKTAEVSYDLEYGTDTLCVHTDDVSPDDKILIFDDILATGGTAGAMCRLAENLGASVCACAFIMELSFLNGRGKLAGKKVISMRIE